MIKNPKINDKVWILDFSSSWVFLMECKITELLNKDSLINIENSTGDIITTSCHMCWKSKSALLKDLSDEENIIYYKQNDKKSKKK
jgi:hypothetical protein